MAPDSTRIFERELTNGVLDKDWTHTLDDEGRVVNSLMLDGAGEPRYHIVRAYDGAETVTTYEWLRTSQYSGSPLRREKTVDEERDGTGNWTRRMIYEWDASTAAWKAKEMLTRLVSYR